MCLTYEAEDLGSIEIVYNSETGKGSEGTIEQELKNGESVRFTVTNSYEYDAWISFAESTQAEFIVFYEYEETDLESLTDYTYSKSGRTFIKPG